MIFSILLLTILDIVYTNVFNNSIPRDKLQFALKTHNKKYENVFIGSSRVANHIDVKYLDSISGVGNLNLGVEGANYGDNLLMLKLFIANGNKINRIFLQLDYFYEQNEFSSIANSTALPFIRHDIVKEHFKKYDKQFNKYYYLPFYRYQSADFKIGFREFFMAVLNKKSNVNFEYGFIPKYGKASILKPEKLPETLTSSNVYVEEIFKLCKQNNIKVVLFTAPFCSTIENSSYINKLKDRYPNLNDYSKSINDSFFYNCSHLNNDGARIFSQIIFKKHFKND